MRQPRGTGSGSVWSEAASAMAEVGLLAFARTAGEVGRGVLPPIELASASTNSRSRSCWPSSV